MLPSLSYNKLVTLAKMCGGLAALMLFAVFVSAGGLDKFSLLAAAGDPVLTIAPDAGSSASPLPIGGSANIVWSTQNVSAPASTYCFGNGSACNTAYQSFLMTSKNDIATTTDGTNLWLVSQNVAYSAIVFQGDPVPVTGLSTYKWLSSQSCWGNSTSSVCGFPQQNNIRVGGDMVIPFTIGTTRYIASLSFNGRTVTVFKWMTTGATGTACAGGGGWGNGTTCAATSTSYMMRIPSSAAMDNGSRFFAVGGNYYLQLGNALYKWSTGTGCPSGGMWGTGTACTAYAPPPSTATSPAYQSITWADEGTVTTIAGVPYLTGVNSQESGPSGQVFKWTTTGSAPCTTSGGWGNGTTCGSTYQSFKTATLPDDSEIGHADTYNYQGATFLVSGQNVYKWTMPGTGIANCPTGGGWGNGTSSCATTSIKALASRLSDSSSIGPGMFIEGGGNFYVISGGKVYKWLSASNCFGSDTAGCNSSFQNISPNSNGDPEDGDYGWGYGMTTFSWGGVPYVSFADSNGNLLTFKGASVATNPLPCFGDGFTCGSSVSSFSDTAQSNEIDYLDIFPYSGKTILLRTSTTWNSSFGTTSGSQIYIWASSCGTGGGFGGSTDSEDCGSDTDQGISNVLQPDVSVISGIPFLFNRKANTASPYNLITYKSTPNCASAYPDWVVALFGDGNTCDQPIPTGLLPNRQTVPDSFTNGSASYAVAYDITNPTTLNIYQWISGSLCLGDGGSTCNTPIQTIASPMTLSFDAHPSFFQSGTDWFLTLFNGSTGTIYVYKWMTSPANGGKGCFGDGTTCGSLLATQTGLPSGWSAAKFFTNSSNVYLTTLVTGTSGTLRLYQWMPSSSCFGDSYVCGALLNSQTLTTGSQSATDIAPFNIATASYLTATAHTSSRFTNSVYKWVPASPSACHVNGPSGTLWAGYSGTQSTGPLTQTTTYTLVCQTNLGQMTQQATVYVAAPPQVSVVASDGTATEGATPADTGTFRITRGNGGGSGPVQVFLTSVSGWVQRNAPGSWAAITSSADGSKLAAVDNDDGYIWTSGDSGTTWTPHTSTGGNTWSGITSSSDGTKLAVVVSGGYVYTSTDSGITWTQRTSAGRSGWSGITSSSDGTKLAAAVSGSTGSIYTSADSGATWTQQTSSSNHSWSEITSSADGTKLAATVNNGYIYTSTNSGVTWTQQTGSGSRTWTSITSSSDGTKLAAAVSGTGSIYTSTDSGVTWTQRTGAGTGSWVSITSSSDGTKLAAVANGGYVYISSDSGATWTQQTSLGSGAWTGITSSADGTKFAVVVGGGNIYTYSSATQWTVPSDWNSSNNTVEIIGGGGGGGEAYGGGGGAYSKVVNVSLTPGSPVSYQIGAGGSAGSYFAGANGGDTYLCNSISNCGSIVGTAVVAGAKGGEGGGFPSDPGLGGAGTSGVGTTKYAGGDGNLGGGGAAGPNGAGKSASLTGNNGGAGDNGSGGSGGASNAAGGNGAEWGSVGAGGGGGASPAGNGLSGGNYGAGGGGSQAISGLPTGGAGSQGIIVITYTSSGSANTSSPLPVVFSLATGGTNALRTTDYTLSGAGITNPSGTTLTIPAGLSYVDVTVTPVDDSLAESTEPITLSIQSPGDSSYTIGSPSSATVNLVDNDTLVNTLPTLTNCTGTLMPPSCTLGISPSRVRKGGTVSVTWSVVGLVSNNACQITSSPAVSGFPQTWNQSGTSWVNNTGVSATIQQATIFTLTCTAPGLSPAATSKTVTIVPSYQEI